MNEEGGRAGVEAVRGLGDVEGFWGVGGVLGGREVFGGPLLVRVGRHGLVWFGLAGWVSRLEIVCGWVDCWGEGGESKGKGI